MLHCMKKRCSHFENTGILIFISSSPTIVHFSFTSEILLGSTEGVGKYIVTGSYLNEINACIQGGLYYISLCYISRV